MKTQTDVFRGRDFWIEENRRYSQPHFRLEKCARIVNALSRGKECDLLDVGCGPATLVRLLRKNVNYHGIDIAIHAPAPNLIEADFIENQIGFKGKSFDIIIAAGLFEYLGDLQDCKLLEIAHILKPHGTFIASYTNFDHIHAFRYPPYNNIMSLEDFKNSLGSVFRIERYFPVSHNWMASDPRRKWLKEVQMPLNLNIPVLSRWFGVGFFFICSKAESCV